MSRDPLGIWGDPGQVGNGQSYCGNNPVNRVDPMGLSDRGKTWEIIAEPGGILVEIRVVDYLFGVRRLRVMKVRKRNGGRNPMVQLPPIPREEMNDQMARAQDVVRTGGAFTWFGSTPPIDPPRPDQVESEEITLYSGNNEDDASEHTTTVFDDNGIVVRTVKTRNTFTPEGELEKATRYEDGRRTTETYYDEAGEVAARTEFDPEAGLPTSTAVNDPRSGVPSRVVEYSNWRSRPDGTLVADVRERYRDENGDWHFKDSTARFPGGFGGGERPFPPPGSGE